MSKLIQAYTSNGMIIGSYLDFGSTFISDDINSNGDLADFSLNVKGGKRKIKDNFKKMIRKNIPNLKIDRCLFF